MDDEQRKEVELQVRRYLASEAGSHREFVEKQTHVHNDFLDRQFKRVIWGIGVLGATATAIFIWYMGKSLDGAEKRLGIEVDRKVLEYSVDEGLRKHVNNLTEGIVTGEDFARRIDSIILERSSKLVPEEVDRAVADQLSEQVAILEKENIEQLVARAAGSRIRDVDERIVNLERASLRLTVGEEVVAIANNRPGPVPVALGPIENRICFLVGAGFEDLDGNGEPGICHVYKAVGGVWYLKAELGATSDADAYCQARCLLWEIGGGG